jgi:hypothetical protein
MHLSTSLGRSDALSKEVWRRIDTDRKFGEENSYGNTKARKI